MYVENSAGIRNLSAFNRLLGGRWGAMIQKRAYAVRGVRLAVGFQPV